MRNSRSALFLCGIALCFHTSILGQTWTQISSGTIKSLRSVEFANDYIGWAVGDGGTILKSTDGGSSWSSQTSGTTKGLNDLYVYSKDTVIVMSGTKKKLRDFDAVARGKSSFGDPSTITHFDEK